MEKLAVITGANSGLGYEVALQLAKDKNWKVVMANRNKVDSTIAMYKIKSITSNSNISFLALDLSDFKSIQDFVNNTKADVCKDQKIDLLINNAGLQSIHEGKFTKQGNELTFGVNYLGPFLLTMHLIESNLLNDNIINVASGVHNPDLKTMIPIPNIPSIHKIAYGLVNQDKDIVFLGRERYSTSKLCNILFTYSLNKYLRNQTSNLKVHAYDPGMIPGTGLAREASSLEFFAWRFILPVFTVFSNRINTREQSAKGLLNILKLTTADSVSGKYYFVGGEELSSTQSYDLNLQEELWQYSKDIYKEYLSY